MAIVKSVAAENSIVIRIGDEGRDWRREGGAPRVADATGAAVGF
jgi:hypothetical protein